jgi:DNA repair protein RecO (recombination protein O)
MLTKDLAICIRAIDYSETSQIVTFFTKEHGKIGAIAKGSKRPKSAFDEPIEIFSYGNIVFAGSDRDKLATLTEFDLDYSNTVGTVLYKNIFILNCCFFAAELLTKLTDDYDPHPELFDGFLGFLQNARESKENEILSFLIMFQLILLREVGLQPVLNCCANCKTQYAIRNTQYDYYFSSSANGLICKDCEMSFPDKIRLSKQAANCLANLKQITRAPESTLNEIEKILILHFTSILGYQLKMGKYVIK